MDRRKFVTSTLLSAPILGSSVLQAAPMAGELIQEWYELRTYVFANETQRQLTESYLEHAYLPALNRAKIKPVGVFLEQQQEQRSASLFLLIPFNFIEQIAAINQIISRDKDYLSAGEAYLNAPATSPAYQRIESALLRAFKHMPRIEAPAKKERLFELRCYESPTESAGQKKIEMFNDAGEIDIFKKIGARPVFFGETIIGDKRPNLTYMLCFDNMDDHNARWKAFGSDPDWKAISSKPEFSDAKLISKITRTFLSPAPYSQV